MDDEEVGSSLRGRFPDMGHSPDNRRTRGSTSRPYTNNGWTDQMDDEDVFLPQRFLSGVVLQNTNIQAKKICINGNPIPSNNQVITPEDRKYCERKAKENEVRMEDMRKKFDDMRKGFPKSSISVLQNTNIQGTKICINGNPISSNNQVITPEDRKYCERKAKEYEVRIEDMRNGFPKSLRWKNVFSGIPKKNDVW